MPWFWSTTKPGKWVQKFFPFETFQKFFSYLDRECKDKILHIFYFILSCSYANLLRVYGLINWVISSSNIGDETEHRCIHVGLTMGPNVHG